MTGAVHSGGLWVYVRVVGIWEFYVLSTQFIKIILFFYCIYLRGREREQVSAYGMVYSLNAFSALFWEPQTQSKSSKIEGRPGTRIQLLQYEMGSLKL